MFQQAQLKQLFQHKLLEQPPKEILCFSNCCWNSCCNKDCWNSCSNKGCWNKEQPPNKCLFQQSLLKQLFQQVSAQSVPNQSVPFQSVPDQSVPYFRDPFSPSRLFVISSGRYDIPECTPINVDTMAKYCTHTILSTFCVHLTIQNQPLFPSISSFSIRFRLPTL